MNKLSELEQLIKDRERIVEELDERLKEIPKIHSCLYSSLPLGQLWCNNLNVRISTSYCNNCVVFSDKYLNWEKVI